VIGNGYFATVLLLTLLVLAALPVPAATPRVEPLLFGHQLVLGGLAISVLPNGTLGGATRDGILLFERVGCQIRTTNWDTLASSQGPLETLEAPTVEFTATPELVRAVSSGVMGGTGAGDGRWRYTQTLTLDRTGRLTVHYRIVPVAAGRQEVRYLYVQLEMPVTTYAKVPVQVEDLAGHRTLIPEYSGNTPGKTRRITFTQPAPGWSVIPDANLQQVELRNVGWACLTNLIAICYRLEQPVELTVVLDLGRPPVARPDRPDPSDQSDLQNPATSPPTPRKTTP